MRSELRTTESGRILWLTDGKTELGVALDHGIRIAHLSCAGMQNLCYRQPADLGDGLCTPQGWRVYGGHRFWIAPEGEDSYYPDNDPVFYELLPDGVTVTQKEDPWLSVRKSMTLRFLPSGELEVTHRLENLGEKRELALWGVTTMAGGEAEIAFADDGSAVYNPTRNLSLWGETSLGDPRVRFTKDRVTVTHRAGETAYLKLGVWSAQGVARARNFGQEFTVRFSAEGKPEDYADRGCNAEIYADAHVLELETLGRRVTLAHGESAGMTEHWSLRAL